MVTHSLPGSEDITRVELPNGIVVLARENFFSQSIGFQGFIQSGSLFDPPEKLGLSEFTSALMMRGTLRRGFDQFFEAQESVGARLGLSSGTHLSAVSGYCLAEDLPDQLNLLSEMLREPLFDPSEMEKLRLQFLTGLDLRSHSTGAVAELAYDALMYGGHPYARPDDGYPETVRAITREDILDHHRATFGPAGMAICLVGAVKASQAVEWLEQALGDWQNPAQKSPIIIPDATPPAEPQRSDLFLPGKTQTDLIMGVMAMKRTDPEYLPARMANSILGQFGMMGRIGTEVREKSGLAYYASSSIGGAVAQGTWDFSAGINPENLDKTIALIHKVIREFLEEGASQDEITDNQDAIIGRLPLSLESNRGVAKAVLDLERKQLSFDYYYNYASTIRAITREQVTEAARKYLFSPNFVISSCGPRISKKGK